jgi:hypothetical protein
MFYAFLNQDLRVDVGAEVHAPATVAPEATEVLQGPPQEALGEGIFVQIFLACWYNNFTLQGHA